MDSMRRVERRSVTRQQPGCGIAVFGGWTLPALVFAVVLDPSRTPPTHNVIPGIAAVVYCRVESVYQQ